jgi:hypothetical protein
MKNIYRVAAGVHFDEGGTCYEKGELVTSALPLTSLFMGKFELVGPAPTTTQTSPVTPASAADDETDDDSEEEDDDSEEEEAPKRRGRGRK